jgi:hypothetical protein
MGVKRNGHGLELATTRYWHAIILRTSADILRHFNLSDSFFATSRVMLGI